MNRIYTIIEACAKKSNLFPLIGLLIFWNILMNTPGLPTSTPSMQKIAPSFTPFDLQASGYSVESFTKDLSMLGEDGRAIYLNFMLLDIFFPLIYGLTFAALIFLVFHTKTNGWKWLFLVPLFTAGADYLENIFLAISFIGFPESNAMIVALASFATQLKMLFNVLLIVSLLFTLGTWLASVILKKS